MGILDRYILRVFLTYWFVIGACLLGLFSVFDLLGHGDEIGESAELYGSIFMEVLRYYLLNLPFLLVMFAPYLTLFAGMATVMHLAKAREWTPMLTSGRPTLRAFLPMFFGGFLLAVGVVEMREILLPKIVSPREALMRRLFHQREWKMKDLWARGQGDVRLRAGLFEPGSKLGLPGSDGDIRLPQIQNLEVYSYGEAGLPRLLLAENATWDGFVWNLENGREVTGGLGEKEILTWYHPGLMPRDLVLAYFGQVSPLDLSARHLGNLLQRDPDHRQAATLRWSWYVSPLSHVLLLLLGLPFVLRFDRRSTLEGVGLGFLLSAFYFVADFLLRDLGGRGVIAPWMGGIGAVLLFGSLGVWAQDRLAT